MLAASSLRRLVAGAIALWPFALSAAEKSPMTPAIAERVLGRADDVTREFRRMIHDDSKQNLKDVTDTASPEWRLYHRDRQLLFAVPTRRNLTAVDKEQGEEEARELAVVLLQQLFPNQLALGANTELAPDAVRVVFIEPAARNLYAGSVATGLVGAPLPFAWAGFWPATWSPQGDCGCR